MKCRIAALLLFAFAAAADAQTVLTLSESAERELTQDRLTVSLRAEASAATAAAAQAETNRRMEAAVARAKTVAGVAVQTGGAWANEERVQGRPVRWRAVATLDLISSDAASLLALVGGLQETGLAISGMGFDLTREAARAAQDALTEEALARLQSRAARVAAALDRRVAAIRTIRIGETGGAVPQPRLAMRAAVAMADAAHAPVAEPGRTSVRIDVEAEILLEPK
ncbi:MAG: SIMPL domain-containing protein [Telmatospirillum sp.]|nr:SIMPL domain-containing protein [Telmatospirillum sp.]